MPMPRKNRSLPRAVARPAVAGGTRDAVAEGIDHMVGRGPDGPCPRRSTRARRARGSRHAWPSTRSRPLRGRPSRAGDRRSARRHPALGEAGDQPDVVEDHACVTAGHAARGARGDVGRAGQRRDARDRQEPRVGGDLGQRVGGGAVRGAAGGGRGRGRGVREQGRRRGIRRGRRGQDAGVGAGGAAMRRRRQRVGEAPRGADVRRGPAGRRRPTEPPPAGRARASRVAWPVAPGMRVGQARYAPGRPDRRRGARRARAPRRRGDRVDDRPNRRGGLAGRRRDGVDGTARPAAAGAGGLGPAVDVTVSTVCLTAEPAPPGRAGPRDRSVDWVTVSTVR